MSDLFDKPADDLDVVAEQLRHVAPSDFETITIELDREWAAALLARHRGIDQLDLYDARTINAVLADIATQAIQAHLETGSAEQAWSNHLDQLSRPT